MCIYMTSLSICVYYIRHSPCLQAHYGVWFAKPLACFSPQVLRKAKCHYSDISLRGPHFTAPRKSQFLQSEGVSGEPNPYLQGRVPTLVNYSPLGDPGGTQFFFLFCNALQEAL